MIGMTSEIRSRFRPLAIKGLVDRGLIFVNVRLYRLICPVFRIAQCFFVIETIRSYLCLVLFARFTSNRILLQRS